MTQNLHFHRIDPSCNMARFYGLSVEPTLFGEWVLMRCWGRIGTAGQGKLQTFASQSDALAEQDRMAHRKRRRGYQERR
jgi:predicted DNA-binding WGR domain protein